MSDTLGRRASLFIGSLILLAGVAVQFAAPTVKLFIGARVIRKLLPALAVLISQLVQLGSA